HYAFDTWMARQFPSCPFERYADDILVHCDTEQKARNLWAAIANRLKAFGLELHPDKTRIVYCKDTKRRRDYEHTSFDFLGYTFRGRRAKGRRGYFVSFSPAMSRKARKAVNKKIRELAPRASCWNGPVRPRQGDQPQGPRLDQLLRSLLPLRVVLPRMASRPAPDS